MRARDAFAALVLLAAGSGKDEAAIRLAAAEAGVEDTFRLLGWRDDVADLYCAADIFVFASHREGLPIAPIEAMASGLPVVSYATGSIPELVGDDGGAVVPYGANYWKLEPPDTEALADAALKVLDKSEDYRKSARIRAEENFSLEKMTARYKKVLTED